MDHNNQDGNGPNVGGGATGADFVPAALTAEGGGAGVGGVGQNQGQGVQNQGQRPLAPGGLAAVNNAINNVQLQLQLEQYDRETLMAEAIIAEQDKVMKDAIRKKKAALLCIHAAAAKKSADLNSDKPLEDYYEKYGGRGGRVFAVAKSSLNSLIEQRRQLNNFNQLLKRNYLPDASEHSVDKGKMPKTTFVRTYKDPLTKTTFVRTYQDPPPKMQWIQKPKMIRLGEEGSSQGNFLQLRNEHDSSADFDLEQQCSEMNRQFGMATSLSLEPEDSRNNNDNIDHIKEEMNIKQE